MKSGKIKSLIWIAALLLLFFYIVSCKTIGLQGGGYILEVKKEDSLCWCRAYFYQSTDYEFKQQWFRCPTQTPKGDSIYFIVKHK